MTGSAHFQTYEHNLRRILLADWLDHEHLRRSLSMIDARRARSADDPLDRPYWLRTAERVALAG